MDPADHFSAEHRELLLELSVLLSEQRGVDEVFAAFSAHVRHGMTFDFTSLFVTTADPALIRDCGHYPPGGDFTALGTIHRASDMGMDQPGIIGGAEYIPRKLDLPSTRALAEAGYQRAWVTALRVDGETYGMLTVAKLAHGAFPPDHIAFLQAAASLLARAVRQDLELERARQTAARAEAARELIFALQAHEPFETIFQRLPSLLEGCMEVDYVGLVMDHGEGFLVAAETPAGVHRGLPGRAEGDAIVHSLAAQGEFIQFRPGPGWSEALYEAGFKRGSLSFLRDGEALRGIFMLARRSRRKFDEDEQRFIDLLKSILSQSLANQWRLDRTETAAARARTLNEIALLVNAGEGIDRIFERLGELLHRSIGLDYVSLLEAGEEPGTLVVVGSRPETARAPGTQVPVDSATIAPIDEVGALAQYDLAAWAERSETARLGLEFGMRSAATVPIRQGGELMGILSLARVKPRPFDSEEEAFLGTLSSMLGQAIANRRRLAAAQTEAARNGLLNELALLLNRGESPSAFFQSVSVHLKSVVPFDGLALCLSEESGSRFRVVDSSRRGGFAPGDEVTLEMLGERVAGMLEAGGTVVEGPANEAGSAVGEISERKGVRRGAVAAIRHGGELLGFFLIGRHSRRSFNDGERAFIELVCVLVGQAIANHRKVADKEAEAIRSQVLSELAFLLQRGHHISEHFDDLCRILLQAVGFDFVSISTRDPATGSFVPLRTHELVDEDGRPVPFRPETIETIRRRGGASLQYATENLSEPVPRALYRAGFQRAVTAAIISTDGPQGLLTIGRRERSRFSAEEMRFVELLAALLGQATANYAEQHTRAAEALRSRVLGELALLLNNGEPIEKHFERLREVLLEGVGFDYCSIAVRLPGSDSYRVLRSTEIHGSAEAAPAFSPALIETILARGAFSSQYGPDAVERGAPPALFAHGIERGASFVLTTGAAPEGLLTVGRRGREPFTADEMAFFEVVASLLANVAANERRLRQSAAEAEDQAIVAEAAAAVARETEVLPIVLSLKEAVGRFMPEPYVRFGYLEGDSLVVYRRDGTRAAQPLGHYLQEAARTGQALVPPVAVRRAAGLPTANSQRDGVESVVITRAESGGTAVGYLILGSRAEDFVPGPRELSLCRQIAGIVGPAMANARAAERERAEAEEQAIIAAAAAAVAGEVDPLAIVLSLKQAVGRFVPRPFVNFGYLEGDRVVFPSKAGAARAVPIGPRFADALRDGQAIVPASADRVDEIQDEPRRVGLEAHIATRAMSGGAVVGLLVVGSRDASFYPGERELRLSRLMADMLGPAMANSRAVAREREEAEDQAIIADAAAAVARETSPIAIIRGLRSAVERFIPAPFVNFGYLDGDGVRFASRTGLLEVLSIDYYFNRALEEGQVIVPSTSSRIAAGETHLDEMTQLGIESHIVSRAMSAGTVAGLLIIGSRDAAFVPRARELRLSRLIADIVGPAMANARSLERERLEADDQRILAQTAAAVAASATETDLIDALQGPIRELDPQGRVLFFYIDGDRAHTPGWPDALPVDARLLEALKAGQVTVTAEESGLPDFMLRETRARGWQRWVYSLAQSGGDILGMLVVVTADPDHEFSERELRLFRLIGNFAGPAMANLRESARRKAEAEEQRILAEAATALAAGPTEQEILERLTEPIRRFVPGALVAFSYIEGDEMTLWDGSNRRPLHALAREAIATGQVVGDTDHPGMTEASRNLIRGAGIRQFCDSAAVSGGMPIGLLFVGSPEEDFRFSDSALRMLRMIAGILGPAMANARASRRVAEEAEDERIVSEVAALAARTGSADLVAGLPAALEPLIPRAFAIYGFFDGEKITYRLSDAAQREAFGADEVTMLLSSVGRAARETGQAIGSLATAPADAPYARFGLQAYSITSYSSGGTPGALMVASADPAFSFSERSLALLRRVTQVVGPAVDSARVEEERARQAALYSLILRSLSEGVILSDFEGRVLFANHLGRRILRALDPEQTGHHWTDIVELLPEPVREGYRAVYERGEGSRGRAAIEIDGRTAWFDYEMVPLNDPVMRILVVAADVTADVEREGEQERHREQMAQAQRLAALGELVGGVAHELNNPLTAILGFAEVMALSPAAGPLAEELGIIQKEALRARNIVRDLLFIVRPGTAERSVIDVAALVAHIERLRRSDWTKAGIEWECSIEPGCEVWGNEHQLMQVLLNLVTNAEHAVVDQRTRRISLSARCAGGSTEITLADSGVGMDETIRSRVFEPFFTTKQGVGTGLGLPLSYSIVQSHGGEIRVESAPGEGSRFTVVLPSAAQAQGVLPAAPAVAASAKTRILVIDDEPSLRKVCQRLVASMGHDCVTAENCAAALELAAGQDFDIVLCDYRLASETADKIIAGFEQIAPHLIARTVIATGATTDPGVVELTGRYGLRLMAKPYGMEELASIIQPAGIG